MLYCNIHTGVTSLPYEFVNDEASFFGREKTYYSTDTGSASLQYGYISDHLALSWLWMFHYNKSIGRALILNDSVNDIAFHQIL